MTPTDEFLGRRRIPEPRYRSMKYENLNGIWNSERLLRWKKGTSKGSWCKWRFSYFIDAPKIHLLKFPTISELDLNQAMTLVFESMAEKKFMLLFLKTILTCGVKLLLKSLYVQRLQEFSFQTIYNKGWLVNLRLITNVNIIGYVG